MDLVRDDAAASARLCVETLRPVIMLSLAPKQPPPRGCVLKQRDMTNYATGLNAAASARLCVETAM